MTFQDRFSHLQRVFPWIRNNPWKAGLIGIAIVGMGWYGYSRYATHTPTQYALAMVSRGNLTVTVTGTGQVAADNQVDLKPQGSTQSAATISRLYVSQGDQVNKGDLIAVIDNHAALVQLEQAKASVQSSQANYNKITAGATSQSLAVSQASIANASSTLANALQNLTIKITSVYNNQLTNIYTNTNIFFNGPNSDNPQYGNFPSGINSYPISMAMTGTINSERAEINKRLATWNTAITSGPRDPLALSAQSKDNLNYILGYLNNIVSDLTNYESNPSVLSQYVSTINTTRSSVLNDIASLTTAEQAVTNAQNSITQSNASYAQTAAPPRQEDIDAAQAQLTNAKANLDNAEYNYDQSFIRAPFGGIVAQVPVSQGDQANTATTIATLITNAQIAKITLNEVDAAKVTVGATTTLTFDALPGVTIAGTVAQIDTIGSVNQGVVSYSAEIAFDPGSNEIKPGMSVSASIVTHTNSDVLLVQSSAVHTQNGRSYVLVPDSTDPAVVAFTQSIQARMASSTHKMPEGTASSTHASSSFAGGYAASRSGARTGANQTGVTLATAPVQVPVTIGDTDTIRTVITGGLDEHEVIVARTIATSSTATTASTRTSGGFGGGPGIRF